MPRRRDPHTKDLFSWEPETVSVAYSDEVKGRGDLDSQISRIIGQALRDAKDVGVSRMEIAGRMARYLGRPVSEDALNKWASEASDDRRIPLDAFIALVHAADRVELIGFVAGLFGHAVVPDRYVELAGRNFGVDPRSAAGFNLTTLEPLLADIHHRLAGVTIECLDWLAFIDRYDRPETLFYLDPPYHGSEGDYGKDLFGRDQFALMADRLARLKGSFILSINDVPAIRDLFGAFDIEEVQLVYSVGGRGKHRPARELIVSGV